MAALPTFPQFDVNGDNVSQRWELYCSYIATTSTPKMMSLDEIRRVTKDDPTLQAVITALRTNAWHKNENDNICTADFEQFPNCVTNCLLTTI